MTFLCLQCLVINTYFFTSQKLMKYFSMVGWYNRLRKRYLHQVEILSDIFTTCWLLISWKMCFPTIIFTYYQFCGFLCQVQNIFIILALKMVSFSHGQIGKKPHVTNKGIGIMLIYHKQSLTSQFYNSCSLLFIVHMFQ